MEPLASVGIVGFRVFQIFFEFFKQGGVGNPQAFGGLTFAGRLFESFVDNLLFEALYLLRQGSGA